MSTDQSHANTNISSLTKSLALKMRFEKKNHTKVREITTVILNNNTFF